MAFRWQTCACLPDVMESCGMGVVVMHEWAKSTILYFRNVTEESQQGDNKVTDGSLVYTQYLQVKINS